MPASLDLDTHLASIEAAGTRMLTIASEAGLDAPVPTCPTWDVRALLAHQAMVHRWATAHLRGDDPDAVPSQTAIGTDVDDLPAYVADGVRGLLAALADAPADLRAMTFLNDAPAPREFWARRQAHETTIHMIDALAAALGRLPDADEAAIERPLAIDGTDELLRGFFTRGRTKIATSTPYTVVVEPSDAAQRWVLHVADSLTVEPPGPSLPPDSGASDDATVRLAGPVAEIYRSLWNRGGDVELSGDPAFLDRWRANQRVRWS